MINFLSFTVAILVLLLAIECGCINSGTTNFGAQRRGDRRHQQSLLRLAPQQHAVRPRALGAVMILVSDWKGTRGRVCSFNDTMDALVNNWLPHNPHYPVILMDTQSWKRADMVPIRRKWPSLDILFLNVEKSFSSGPAGITERQFEDRAKSLSNLRYKRMCNFFWKGFTQEPLLMQFRYLLRLDDDSCFRDNINYDMFLEMHSREAHYAYTAQSFDADFVVVGLNEFAERYVHEHNLTWANPQLRRMATKPRFSDRNLTIMFMNNFEIIDTLRYRQRDIMQFVDAVWSSNMIFHRRWGDAPLRYLLAQMFWTEEQVLRLCEFDYQHSTWPVMEQCEHRGMPNRVSAGLDPAR